MFGIIPLMKPIAIIPGAVSESILIFSIILLSDANTCLDLLKNAVVHRFDTLQAVPVSPTPLPFRLTWLVTQLDP